MVKKKCGCTDEQAQCEKKHQNDEKIEQSWGVINRAKGRNIVLQKLNVDNDCQQKCDLKAHHLTRIN